MLHAKRITAFCFALLIASPALSYDEPTLGAHEDWNDLDYIRINEMFKPHNYNRIVIRHVDNSSVPLPDKSDNSYEPVMKALRDFDQNLDAGFKESIVIPSEVAGVTNATGKEKSKKKQAAAESMRGAIVVKAKLIEMEPGSAAARYWAGFGAGAASARIEGKVIDGATGKTLFEFKQTRKGFMSSSGGYEAILAKISQELGEDIGNGIAAFCPKETKRCKKN